MNGLLPIKRLQGMVRLMRRPPLALRRHLWRLKGEGMLFGLWCLRILGKLYPFSHVYGALLARLVSGTGLFDSACYIKVNPDVADSDNDPLSHYIRWGDREGRSPMPLFDPVYYRSHADSFTAEVNSLLHYVWIGCHRDLSPSAWFDSAYYLRRNRDVALSGTNPLYHFITWGAKEGRSPSPEFDVDYYLKAYPDVSESGMNPLVHYVLYGQQEGRRTRPLNESEEMQQPPKLEPVEVDDIIAHFQQRHDDPVVDIIIPVYLDRTLTLRCINSVVRSKVNTPYQIVVVDDDSPEKDLRNDLDRLEKTGIVSLLRNQKNRGFVKSVNRGMRQNPDRDIVLLNSDTEVYDGWLDRLRRHACQDERIASITPLSNNATICSYPKFLHDNPYLLEIDYAELDQLCADINEGVRVEAPTGVGFCMYMRRDAMKAIGLFDEKAFGRGYGEENDWCQRAMERGFSNFIALDTFVRHIGSASFKGEKNERISQALRTLARKYPNYERQVQRFIKKDPLEEYRRRLDIARLKRHSKKQNVLMVCHSRGGGAERHMREDAKKQLDRDRGVFYLRPVPGKPTHGYIQHDECRYLPNLAEFNLSDVKRLVTFITELGVTCIHSHGLVDFEPQAVEHVVNICKTSGISLHVDIHDYKVICPRINLAKNDGVYCGEPKNEAECNTCLRMEGNDFGVTDIGQWRRMHEKALRYAEKVYVPNEDVSVRLGRYFPGIQFKVLPHEEVVYSPAPRKHQPGNKLKVVVIGAISRIKGYDVLLSCAREAQERNLGVEFILLGFSSDDAQLEKYGVIITGRYSEHEVNEKLAEIDADVAFFPATWPETYSYTLSYAIKAGLPIVAFDIGAIANRLSGWPHSKIVPLDMRHDQNFIISQLKEVAL